MKPVPSSKTATLIVRAPLLELHAHRPAGPCFGVAHRIAHESGQQQQQNVVTDGAGQLRPLAASSARLAAETAAGLAGSSRAGSWRRWHPRLKRRAARDRSLARRAFIRSGGRRRFQSPPAARGRTAAARAQRARRTRYAGGRPTPTAAARRAIRARARNRPDARTPRRDRRSPSMVSRLQAASARSTLASMVSAAPRSLRARPTRNRPSTRAADRGRHAVARRTRPATAPKPQRDRHSAGRGRSQMRAPCAG